MDRTGNSILFWTEEKRCRFGICRTSSSTIGKFAFLNNLVGAFEYKVDENGNNQTNENYIWTFKGY